MIRKAFLNLTLLTLLTAPALAITELENYRCGEESFPTIEALDSSIQDFQRLKDQAPATGRRSKSYYQHKIELNGFKRSLLAFDIEGMRASAPQIGTLSSPQTDNRKTRNFYAVQYHIALVSKDWRAFKDVRPQTLPNYKNTFIAPFDDFLLPAHYVAYLGHLNWLAGQDTKKAFDQAERFLTDIKAEYGKRASDGFVTGSANYVRFLEEDYGRVLLQLGWVFRRISHEAGVPAPNFRAKDTLMLAGKSLPDTCAHTLQELAYRGARSARVALRERRKTDKDDQPIFKGQPPLIDKLMKF